MASPKTKKTLGDILHARRRQLQLTQGSLANQLGVGPSHLAYIEADRRLPSLALLSRLAEVLNLDPGKLLRLSHPEARGFIRTFPQSETAAPKDQAWRDFTRNKNVLRRYKVSKKELQVLAQIVGLGRVTTPRSFLFILNSIRLAVDDEGIQRACEAFPRTRAG